MTTTEQKPKHAVHDPAALVISAMTDGTFGAIKLAYAALRAHDYAALAAALEALAVAKAGQELLQIARIAERFKRELLNTTPGRELEQMLAEDGQAKREQRCECSFCTARREGLL